VLKRQMIFAILVLVLSSQASLAQQSILNYEPVTQEMLENPPPGDWLHFSRTYDAQRHSPLDQINRKNVSKLQLA